MKTYGYPDGLRNIVHFVRDVVFQLKRADTLTHNSEIELFVARGTAA